MNQLSYYEDYLVKKQKYEIVKSQYKILSHILKKMSIEKLDKSTQKKYIQFMVVYQKIEDAYNLSAINVKRAQKLKLPMPETEYELLIKIQQEKHDRKIKKLKEK